MSDEKKIQRWNSVKDSGKREEFSTGSKRDSRDGKGRFDLIPPYALLRLAKHYENGSRKYGDRNWEKGQSLGRYLDSALRHLNCVSMGLNDEDHLAAAAWNVLAIIESQKRIDLGLLSKELDDLPKTFSEKDPR